MSESKRTIAGRPADETLQREVFGALGDEGATIESLRKEIDRAKNLGLDEVDLAPGFEYKPEDLEDAISFIMDPRKNKANAETAQMVYRGLGEKLKDTVPFSGKLQTEKPLRDKVSDAFQKALRDSSI